MPESNGAACAEEKHLFVELKHPLGSLMEVQRAHMDALTAGDGQDFSAAVGCQSK